MSTRGRKLQLVVSFAVLLLVAIVAVGCNGFFVDPVLTSMSVSTLQSTNLVNVGNTVQLQATGTYDDSSHKNLTGAATWSVTSNPDFVTVSAGGLVTATKVTPAGTVASVQAAVQSSNGSVVSASIPITLGQSTTLTITSAPASPISLASVPAGTTVTFTATLNGNNVTSSTTFTSSAPTVISTPVGNSATVGGSVGSTTITATDATDNATGTLVIQVTN